MVCPPFGKVSLLAGWGAHPLSVVAMGLQTIGQFKKGETRRDVRK
jgi:hypothetical protein